MKKLFITSVLVFLISLPLLFAQQNVERKILIQNQHCYYFQVDNESQLAKLYTDTINQKIKNYKPYPILIGREFLSPFNPLAFDINNDEMLGVNWMLNSMNSRYESIKN